MPKIPAKLIKGLMKKLEGKSSSITEELNTKHEAMIKAMRAKQVPNTADIEGAMSKPVMKTRPVADIPIDEEAIRPEIANMSKADAAKWREQYMKTPQADNPFKVPGGGIEKSTDEVLEAERLRKARTQVKKPGEDDLPENESDAIDSIMELMKTAKKKTK